ncbi:thioredoxin [Deinococcus sp. HMF7620]|uniref:Thioredoxin n=1 Tax=Deinococcus arboris TaxID=2682977 RepID=A0A7C9HZX8_9DEIO|nr:MULTISPECIES: thioredoxin family protein [Deinococcus]MBZ9752173.1 thioredoxin family protein [Deinococcus betulae]MVN87475.1 thioredoxin [Deinococcus arboris]
MNRLRESLDRGSGGSRKLYMEGIMQILTDETFNASIQQGVWVVHFTSPTCAPCKAVYPILEEMEREQGRTISFGVVNTREEFATAISNRVTSNPTVIIYKDSEPMNIINGAYKKTVYEEAVQQVLAL